MVDEVIEKPATLSCPEIARHVVLNEQGVDFIREVEPRDTIGVIQKNTCRKISRDYFRIKEYLRL